MMAAVSAPALAALASQPRHAHDASTQPVMHFHVLAYDGRFSAAASFATEARRLGATVKDTQGDITALWYQDLYHRWQLSPEPVAGITPFNSLLGLQMMASTAGLRVIYRAHHHRDGEQVTHELFGPRAMLSAATRLTGADEQWGRSAAQIILRWPAGLAPLARSESTILDSDRRSVSADSLISWILAPVAEPERA
jgi:hypothetical protein